MAIHKKLDAYLKQAKVKFDVVSHKTVFTVYDLAQTLKEKFESIAKTLLVKVDKEYVLVVMPANQRLDFGKLKKALQAKEIRLAKEKEMKDKFKVAPGSMTPFGPLYKVSVVVDKSLTKTKQALFSAGSFTDSVRMKVSDFVKIVDPKIALIAQKVKLTLQQPKKKTVKSKKPKAKKAKRKR